MVFITLHLINCFRCGVCGKDLAAYVKKRENIGVNLADGLKCCLVYMEMAKHLAGMSKIHK